MSSHLTTKQWITVILVNVVISAVTTLLIVRVLTSQPGARLVSAPAPTEQPAIAAAPAVTVARAIAGNPSPTPLPSATPAPAAVPAIKPSNTPTPLPPTNTPVPLPTPTRGPSPTVSPTPRSTGNVGISTVLNVGQKQREVVVIANLSTEVSLKGWTLTSSRNISYTFGNVTLFRDSFINLHTTIGADVPTDLFMNRNDAAWQIGDVVTLSNQGQIVATATVKQQ